MAIQQSATTRNRLRDAFIAAFPVGTTIQFRTGAPAGVSNAAGGSLIATITLPASPFTSGTGQVTLNGTWSTTASGTGVIAHYRMVNAVNDIEEGTVTLTAGGGDLELDNTNVATSQTVQLTTFTRVMPAA